MIRSVTAIASLTKHQSPTLRSASFAYFREWWRKASLPLLAKLTDTGHITHRLRPTYYSPSSRTALAESELSYKDGHKSRSVYVGFPVEQNDMSEGLKEAFDSTTKQTGSSSLNLAVWTTTAWTLPANAVREFRASPNALQPDPDRV